MITIIISTILNIIGDVLRNHVMCTGILITLTMNIRYKQFMRKAATALIWNRYPSCKNRVTVGKT